MAVSAHLDGRMLLFAVGLAGITSLVFGLYPALQASRASLTEALRDQSGQTTGGRTTGLFRKALVTLQTAVSVLLLVSAGLFGKTLVSLTRVNLGLQPDHLLMFSLNPKLNGYNDARTAQLYVDLRDRLATLPGVVSASASRVPAIANSSSSGDVTVEGNTPPAEGHADARRNEVGPDYFRTMGIPLIAGREFTPGDRPGGAKAAIVNQALVRAFIGTRNPIGLGVYRGTNTSPITYDTFIVGVVKDSLYRDLRETPQPVWYTASSQSPLQRSMFFYVRTAEDPVRLAGAIRSAVASFDPNLPIVGLQRMQDQLKADVASERLLSLLTGTFAGLATLLAAVGLYGVLAFNVARRTREIGIRMALGAGAAQVRRLMAREVATIVGIGLATGLLAAVLSGRLIQAVLFNTTPADPWVFGAASLLLAGVALVALYVPTRRATAVDPMIALRCD